MMSGDLIRTLRMIRVIKFNSLKVSLKRYFYFISFLCLTLSAFGQSTTGSVYGIYGIGTLYTDGMGAYRSMNNAAIGSRLPGAVNLKNPAALSAVNIATQIFDVDLAAKSLHQKTSSSSTSAMVGGLENLNLWLHLGQKTGMVMGMNQFSDARYDITNDKRSSSIGTYSVRYQGSGGLFQMYVGAGHSIGKYLSVGAKGSFLFGKITSQQTIGTNGLVSGVESTESRVLKQFVVDLGTQLTIPISTNHQITLGFIYRPSYNLNFRTEDKLIQNTSDSVTSYSKSNMIFPEKYGVGFEYRMRRLTISVDGELDKWGVNGKQDGYNYIDQYSLSAGVSYQNDPDSYTYFNRMAFRAGFGMKNYYVQVNGTQFGNQSFSLGVGLPVSRGFGMLNVGYKYAGLGTTDNNLVYEQLHTFTVNMSIRDMWFRKNVFD